MKNIFTDWEDDKFNHNIELNIFQIFHNANFFRPLNIYIGTGEFLRFGIEILGFEGRWNWCAGFLIYWERIAGWEIDFLWLKLPIEKLRVWLELRRRHR